MYIYVEGDTEEGFCKQVLQPFLSNHSIFVYVINVGGLRKPFYSYVDFRNQLIKHIKQESKNSEVRFTTMFDLYALPNDFPRSKEATAYRNTDPYQRVKILEDAMKKDIDCEIFVPYIQLHEFEALLFVNIDSLLVPFPYKVSQIEKLKDSVVTFNNPELIDDGRHTAPSKRIIRFIKEYEPEKKSAGPIAAKKIGIDNIRKKCSHFDEWVSALIDLGKGY